MNKTETIKDYYQRINKVLVYINENLEENLTLDKLAAISNFSPFHFHRIMKAHLNESLGSYIFRVRLDTGAKLIKLTNEPLNEIAYKIGYETPSSFSKAFKQRFGVSPIDYRNSNSFTLNIKYEHFNFENTMETTNLKPKVKTLKEKKCIYVQVIGEYKNENISKAWDKLMQFAKTNRLFGFSTKYIGISHDNPCITEADKCRYDACVTIRKDVRPEGEIGVQEIKGGKYAIFRFKGPYENIGNMYNAIFRSWLPSSGYEINDIPSFELYLNNPGNTKPEKLLTEIYIPLKN